MKLLLLIFCLISSAFAIVFHTENEPFDEKGIKVVSLKKGKTKHFISLRNAFVERNPGYDLDYVHQSKKIKATDQYRLAFIQEGEGKLAIGDQSSDFSVGDIIYLDKGETLKSEQNLSALIFIVPDALPEEVPAFIRPDWDPNITDIPGGCATERNAYRRILLTWEDKVGTYLYHALNAHRVRIMDSFTHYHPVEGGFDEFYLVQMVLPEARLITSNQVDLIEQPETIDQDQAQNLLDSTPLEVGDLVYIPRGVAHRGLGGVLTQVITVPGFIPGSEIGIDHHLHAIRERFSLSEDQLPLNLEASTKAVIK